MRTTLLLALLLCACRTAPPVATPVVATPGAFEVIEATTSGQIERMHADGEDVVALVRTASGWELVRAAQTAAGWAVVERAPGSEQYLWPTQ